jgi:hypothetical protein
MSRLEELESYVAQLQTELSELVRITAAASLVDALAARVRNLERLLSLVDALASCVRDLERRMDHLEGADHPTRSARRVP